MSTFATVEIACPFCHDSRLRSVAKGVNPERSPHLRQQILDCTFQRVDCDACGKNFALDHPFLYTDFPRKQWIMCFGASQRQKSEGPRGQMLETFKAASNAAERSGVPHLFHGIRPRLVFGVLALREKLISEEAKFDDDVLEAFKHAVLFGEAAQRARRHNLCLLEKTNVSLRFLSYYDDEMESGQFLEIPLEEWLGFQAGWTPLSP